MSAAVKIKICGLTMPDDCHAVCEAGADYAGFVFAPGRRQVDAARARQLVRLLVPEVLPVGVFCEESPAEISRLAQQVGFKIIQLHSRPAPGRITRLRQFLPPEFSIWQMLPVPCHLSAVLALSDAEAALARCRAISAADDRELPDTWLLDSSRDGLAGGTGSVFDWPVFRAFCQENPVIVAGGLNCANVADALVCLLPSGVDCSSGVETDGRKDAGKIHRFCAEVQAFNRQLKEKISGGHDHDAI